MHRLEARAAAGAGRDPAKISGPCPSPPSRGWDAHRCGGAMGRGVARRAQDDGVIRRLRSAFSAIEGRAGRRWDLGMTGLGCAWCQFGLNSAWYCRRGGTGADGLAVPRRWAREWEGEAFPRR